MSRGSQLPVSALIRQGNQLDDVESKRRSKDEYRKQKDLEEQRKAGQAPAMVDVETGRDINPHIPEFIEKTPWYVPTGGPTLKHQRPHPEREKKFASIKDWYDKGTTDKIAFKYRDGACENCGAMGHKKKDCFERPRKIGAKHSNRVIASDDHTLPSFNMNYDAKRDRWNGYNASEYKQVHDEFEKMEETRKLIKAQNMKDGVEQEDDEEEKYADDMAPGQSVDMDSRTRITVRNLRIREDTAKYLLNLNENSAYYDPKSRSMRENPFENMNGKEREAARFSGENFVRFSGEVVESMEAQVFAWQARCKGIDVHSLAEPTKLEQLRKEYETEKSQHKSSVNKDLLDKYGGGEHLSAPPKELLLAQSEHYVEYNRMGNVVKGEERPSVKSRYDEDVLINNHTTVWGSYWRDDQWGFRCCHSFIKNSYCVGEQGILLEQQSSSAMPSAFAANAKPDDNSKLEESERDDTKLGVESLKQDVEKRAKSRSSSESSRDDDNEEEDDNDVEKVSVKEDEADDGASGIQEDEGEKSSSSLDEVEKERERERLENQEKKRETRREKRRRHKQHRKEQQKRLALKAKKKEKRRADRLENGDAALSSSSSESDSGSSSSSSSVSVSDDEEVRGGKHLAKSKELRKAMKQVIREEADGRRAVELGDRKRKYHSHYEEKKPTEVELEAYNLTRIHSSDPMAAYIEEKRDKVETKKARKGSQERI